MPNGIPKGAMCVQRFDDSLNSAIHTTYRISLRSSSMPEPRDPLLKVLTICFSQKILLLQRVYGCPPAGEPTEETKRYSKARVLSQIGADSNGNDPSAGSPTERFVPSSRDSRLATPEVSQGARLYLKRRLLSTHFHLVCERSPWFGPGPRTLGASLRIAHFTEARASDHLSLYYHTP